MMRTSWRRCRRSRKREKKESVYGVLSGALRGGETYAIVAKEVVEVGTTDISGKLAYVNSSRHVWQRVEGEMVEEKENRASPDGRNE